MFQPGPRYPRPGRNRVGYGFRRLFYLADVSSAGLVPVASFWDRVCALEVEEMGEPHLLNHQNLVLDPRSRRKLA